MGPYWKVLSKLQYNTGFILNSTIDHLIQVDLSNLSEWYQVVYKRICFCYIYSLITQHIFSFTCAICLCICKNVRFFLFFIVQSWWQIHYCCMSALIKGLLWLPESYYWKSLASHLFFFSFFWIQPSLWFWSISVFYNNSQTKRLQYRYKEALSDVFRILLGSQHNILEELVKVNTEQGCCNQAWLCSVSWF